MVLQYHLPIRGDTIFLLVLQGGMFVITLPKTIEIKTIKYQHLTPFYGHQVQRSILNHLRSSISRLAFRLMVSCLSIVDSLPQALVFHSGEILNSFLTQVQDQQKGVRYRARVKTLRILGREPEPQKHICLLLYTYRKESMIGKLGLQMSQ